MLTRCAGGRALIALIACVAWLAAAPGCAGSPGAPACAFADVTFEASFDGARLGGCRQAGPDTYVLSIEPEARPINPSPWYAFDVLSEVPQRIVITLDYGDYRHRYPPKVRRGASTWTPLASPVETGDGGKRATFVFEAPAGRSRIAAQQPVTPEDAKAWLRHVARRTPLEWGVLGQSALGIPIPYLAGGSGTSGTLVVIGRQHPPEVTGAYALRAFVERLAADDPLALRFRERYGLFAVPMLNPDGVVRGHWRLDSAGTDLNRDWGPFTRPETRLVRDRLADLHPVLIVDFHSTTRDVLYTPLDDAAIERAWFPAAWHAAIEARLTGPPLARSAAHNPDNPSLKSWAPEALGIPAVTFEVGDATPRERIDTLGRLAAEEAMRLLLEEP